MPGRPSVFASACGIAVLLGSLSTAQAFCRTTTTERVAGSCPEKCVKEGLPLYWQRPNLTYVFNERGFPNLPDAKLRDIIALSFGAWEEVRCQGESIGLDIRPLDGTTSLEVGPENQEPNDNVIVHFSAQQWLAQDLPSQAFALTAIWYDKNTGHILGADMHFNGGMDPFGVCPDEGCASSQRLTDLRNVATHEAGHFLGLAHSENPDSTMWCDANAGDTNKRMLHTDDIEGLCAVYPPGKAFKENSHSTPRGSCSVSSVGGAGSTLFALGFVAALAAWLRRRKGH